MKKKAIRMLSRLLPVFLFLIIVHGFTTVIAAEDEIPVESTPIAEQQDDQSTQPQTTETQVDEPEEMKQEDQEEAQPAKDVQPAQTNAVQEPQLTVSEQTRNITTQTTINGNETWEGDNVKVSGNGKVVVQSGTLTIQNAQISLENLTTGPVFTVRNGATLKLLDQTVFDLTNLSGRRAIVVESGGTLIIENSSVINGDAQSQSPIDLNGAKFYAKDATFENNSGTDGGAIHARQSEMTIDGSVFKDNRAHANTIGPGGGNIESGGGAIHADAATTLTLNGTQFINNYTTNDAQANPMDISYGGAIFFRGHNSKLYINGAKFIGNHTGTSGGAVFVRSSTNVEIKDLNGDPTVFEDNYTTDSHDFAGGGLFINMATVKMWDLAVYNNSAQHAGGGIASCTTGTYEVHSLEGAAIFDNTVEPGGNPDADTPTYKDVFIQTVDHRDVDTGELIPAKEGGIGYENYMPELYERMFNGGLHNWQSKIFDGYNGGGRHVTSFISVSNPSNRDISKAKVIFRNNFAEAGNREGRDYAYGGAIGNNGYLIVGTTTTTEIKVVKVWEDNNNNDGLRPTAKQFLEKIHILDGEGNEVDKSQLQIDIVESNINDYALSGNIVKKHEQPEYGDNAWLIVISGLPLLTTGQYSISEDGVPSYQLVSSTGTDDTYFEITNKHEDEVVDLAVRKVWNDNNDKHKVRPTSVTVRLYADGQEIDSVVLSAENNWQATFGGLQKYNGGVEIEYTISEDAVKYYVAKITGSVEEGFTIENDVDYPEKPKKPEEPEKTKKPNKPEQPKVHGVATGLESMISMYSMMTGLSLVGAVALKRKH